MTQIKKWLIPFVVFVIALFSSSTNHLVSAASNYEDGEYSIPFTVLKGDSAETSMTNDYLQSPGKLIVKDNKNIIQLTLKNKSWWQYFKVNGIDVTVVSENSSADTSVVQFEVQDLTNIIPAKIHVIVPDINYDNKYDIRFQFDSSNIPLAQNISTPSTTSEENGSTDVNDTKVNQDKTVQPTVEKNPPTGDQSPIILFSMMLFATSGFVIYQLVKKSKDKQGAN